jgi:probable F420-dependent oxidoreductase
MAVGVGLGLMEFPFEGGSGFWKWIELCEEGRIDSFWQTDRLISRRPILECMSAMAAVAGATTRMKFGMNVASAGLRDPLQLAKQCATIDFLSDGRLLPAFGLGSALGPDWKATGVPTEGRGRRTDEALDIIAALWRGEEVSGREFYAYDKATISPLPAQKHFPLWIGGSSKAAIRRTARIGTGWLAGRESPSEIGPVIQAIKVACAEVGRSIDDDHYGAGFFYRFGSWDEPFVQKRADDMAKASPSRDAKQAMVVGDAEDLMDRIRAYVDAGVSKFILRPVGENNQEVYDQTRLLVEEIQPAIERLNAEGIKPGAGMQDAAAD